MKKSDLIKEISENLKDLPVTFKYLEAIKDYDACDLQQKISTNNSKAIILKPMRIERYQTLTYMQAGTYFKPVSRCIIPDREAEDDE